MKNMIPCGWCGVLLLGFGLLTSQFALAQPYGATKCSIEVARFHDSTWKTLFHDSKSANLVFDDEASLAAYGLRFLYAGYEIDVTYRHTKPGTYDQIYEGEYISTWSKTDKWAISESITSARYGTVSRFVLFNPDDVNIKYSVLCYYDGTFKPAN